MARRSTVTPIEPTARECEMAAELARAQERGHDHRTVARRLGVSVETVKWWAWRIRARARSRGASGQPTSSRPRAKRKGTTSSAGFVEVRVAPVQPSGFQVLLSGRRRIAVPPGFDAADLRRLLEVLEVSC